MITYFSISFAAKETVDNALDKLRRKLYSAIEENVEKMCSPAKKFDKNIDKVKSQDQLVSSMLTFGKYMGSTSTAGNYKIHFPITLICSNIYLFSYIYANCGD